VQARRVRMSTVTEGQVVQKLLEARRTQMDILRDAEVTILYTSMAFVLLLDSFSRLMSCRICDAQCDEQSKLVAILFFTKGGVTVRECLKK
jgi:hypothetical protein